MSVISLIYYVTCGGRSWSEPTILEWLAKAGFTVIRKRYFPFDVLDYVVLAEKL
jgi:3-polyprenyl-4-hydroxybenzoate decarboxylase